MFHLLHSYTYGSPDHSNHDANRACISLTNQQRTDESRRNIIITVCNQQHKAVISKPSKPCWLMSVLVTATHDMASQFCATAAANRPKYELSKPSKCPSTLLTKIFLHMEWEIRRKAQFLLHAARCKRRGFLLSTIWRWMAWRHTVGSTIKGGADNTWPT